LRMLEDKDRAFRGRAAAALARLSESHPARLLRVSQRLKDGLSDESAFVRWHLVYTMGKLASCYPGQSRAFLSDVVSRLDDENRIVRILSCKALSQVAARKPVVIEDLFQGLKKEVPPSIARTLRRTKAVL